MTPYFQKLFNADGLDLVQYWCCENCGYVASKTHFEMSDDKWQKLNHNFHSSEIARETDPNSSSRQFNQALMLYLLEKGGVITKGKWLDWGSGEGNLSRLLENCFSITLKNYDSYRKPITHCIPQSELKYRSYDLVISTAVFEHVRTRETLNEIESYVSDDGCLAVHTLVRGEIPADPNWFYLLPVHSSFHTNRSMQILMEQWGYTCSVYNEDSKLWIMFRKPCEVVRDQTVRFNYRIGWEYLHFKEGFMDYWP